MRLQALFCMCLIFLVSADIQLTIYDNTILNGNPSKIVSLNSLNYSFDANNPFSAQILGSIIWDKSIDLYYFQCNFDSNLFGFIWIDDHIICAPGIYTDQLFAFWNLTWSYSAYTSRQSFIRIDLYSNQQIQNKNNLHFSLLWSFDNNNSFSIIDNSYLSTFISTQQQQRMSLQNNLTYNTWSTWYYSNMLSIIRLPDSFGLTFGICSAKNIKNCLTTALIETNDFWVGVHSYNHSYFEYNLTWNNQQISYQYASIIVNQSYSNFYAKLTLLSNDNKQSDLPFIDFASKFFWGRNGTSQSIDIINGALYCFQRIKGYGLSQSFDICTNIMNYTSKPGTTDKLFQFTQNDKYTIYFTTNSKIKSIDDISNIIDSNKATEYATYDKYNDLRETAIGIQAGLMWDLAYIPEESGPYNPVSRAWISSNTEWAFLIFDWDNIFASYQLSLSPDGLNLAISNLIQVIKSKTVYGFVPNYKLAGDTSLRASQDRTEPPIGSMVLYKMYEKYGNNIKWLIELLFDDLYDWIRWFWRRRRCPPHNLICLGSDPNPPDVDNPENWMQAARWESGLDNSPMYDGEFYNNITHHMLLYDVGMNAMLMNEMKRLQILGKVINKTDNILNDLQAKYSFLANGMVNVLWNDTMGLFLNKFSVNDSFYPHISPTMFYPLLNGDENIVSIKQAEYMVNNYLLSPDYFCINPLFPMNETDKMCYYGLPSISRNDAAFKSQDYWRGLTWGPMVQLTWWSLDEYSSKSNIVSNGQKALEKQMNAMMLHIWNNKRHICENYSPGNSSNECTGVHFYHWGGLTGFISLIHDYY